MIIKATRLQAWAPAGGGGGKSRPSPPPPSKKIFWAILGAFLLLFLHMGAFLLLFFSFWVPFGYFLFHGVGFFGLASSPYENFTAAHDCKEGSRACSPEIFLCDRNLVSSGHVLLRFCLNPGTPEYRNTYKKTFFVTYL